MDKKKYTAIIPVSYTHLDVYKRQVDIMAEAAKYVDAEKDVADEAAALAGAKDIICLLYTSPCFEDDNIPDSFFEDISDITVVACGTAMYAGMVGTALLKNKFGIPVSCLLYTSRCV